MIIAAGLIIGFAIFVLSLYLNLQVIKRARGMAPRKATQLIVVSYVARAAVLTLFLGLLFWLTGIDLILGILLGMVLGIPALLVIGRSNRSFFERLLNGQVGRY